MTSIKRLVYTRLGGSLTTGLDEEIDAVVDHICGERDRTV